jgi:hypothetical protein
MPANLMAMETIADNRVMRDWKRAAGAIAILRKPHLLTEEIAPRIHAIPMSESPQRRI